MSRWERVTKDDWPQASQQGVPVMREDQMTQENEVARPCSACGKLLSGDVDASWCPTTCTCLGAPWCTECWNRHIDKKEEVAERIFNCFWLYPNYEVGTRGPMGQLLDALDVLMPNLARKIREGDDIGNLRRQYFPTGDELTDDVDEPLPESDSDK